MITRFKAFVASMPFAIGVMIFLLVTSIISTLLPEDQPKTIFYLCFLGASIFLVVSLILCRGLKWPQTFNQWGTYLLHMGIPVLLVGTLMGAFLGKSGDVQVFKGTATNQCYKESGGQFSLPFSVILDNFTLETYPATLKHCLDIYDVSGKLVASVPITQTGNIAVPHIKAMVQLDKWFNDFVFDKNNQVVNQSTQWNNPAIHVVWNDKSFWLFALYPGHANIDHNEIPYQFAYRIEQSGGGVKEYISDVRILENNETLMTKTIKVNQPLTYKGYTFYQMSYDDKKLSWTGLRAKKDPGVGVVYLGSLIMILGLLINLRKPR